MPQWSFINEKHYANLIFQCITYKTYIFGPCPKTVVHSGCWRLRFPWFPVVEPLWTRGLAGPPSYDESAVVAAICWWIIMILKKHMYICLMDRDDSEHISWSRNIYHSIVAYLMFTMKTRKIFSLSARTQISSLCTCQWWCQFGFHGFFSTLCCWRKPRQLTKVTHFPNQNLPTKIVSPWNLGWTRGRWSWPSISGAKSWVSGWLENAGEIP